MTCFLRLRPLLSSPLINHWRLRSQTRDRHPPGNKGQWIGRFFADHSEDRGPHRLASASPKCKNLQTLQRRVPANPIDDERNLDCLSLCISMPLMTSQRAFKRCRSDDAARMQQRNAELPSCTRSQLSDAWCPILIRLISSAGLANASTKTRCYTS